MDETVIDDLQFDDLDSEENVFANEELISEMPGDQRYVSMIREVVEDEGARLYWIGFPKSQAGILRVFIDTDTGVSFELCSKVSKKLLALEGLPEFENLEVSSPGIERPLIIPDHFESVVGCMIKLKTKAILDGVSTKDLQGKLLQINGKDVILELVNSNQVKGKGKKQKANSSSVEAEAFVHQITIPFCEILKANLVFG